MEMLSAGTEFKDLLHQRDFATLKIKLHHCDKQTLVEIWPEFEAMEKAVLFKLLEPAAAMDLYSALGPGEKYFLLGAFEFGCIAPVLEDEPPAVRSLFRALPREYFEEMSRQLT